MKTLYIMPSEESVLGPLLAKEMEIISVKLYHRNDHELARKRDILARIMDRLIHASITNADIPDPYILPDNESIEPEQPSETDLKLEQMEKDNPVIDGAQLPTGTPFKTE